MKVLPAPVVYTWLALSLLLNITGLASIVDGLVIWANFFGSIVEVYQSRVRDPLFAALLWLWPSFLPRPPRWSVDLLVVWSCFYTAFRLFTNFEVPNYMFRSTSSVGFGFIKQLLYFLLGPLAIPYYWLRARTLRNAFADDIRDAQPGRDENRIAFRAAVEKMKSERRSRPLARFAPSEEPGILSAENNWAAESDGVWEAAFYELVTEEASRLAPRALLYYGLVAGIFLMVLFANYQLQRVIS